MSTSPILLAEVGEAPDIAESDTEAQDGEEELHGAVPGDPGLLLHLNADPLLSLVLPHVCPVTHWWRLPCACLPPHSSSGTARHRSGRTAKMENTRIYNTAGLSHFGTRICYRLQGLATRLRRWISFQTLLFGESKAQAQKLLGVAFPYTGESPCCSGPAGRAETPAMSWSSLVVWKEGKETSTLPGPSLVA